MLISRMSLTALSFELIRKKPIHLENSAAKHTNLFFHHFIPNATYLWYGKPLQRIDIFSADLITCSK